MELRANTLKSVIDNYCISKQLQNISRDQVTHLAVKGRITGVQCCCKMFKYLFGVALRQLILQHSDNMSKKVQSPKLSASEGQQMSSLTVATLRSK